MINLIKSERIQDLSRAIREHGKEFDATGIKFL